MKLCPSCLCTKPPNEYYTNVGRRGGGLSYRCIACERVHSRDRWRAKSKTYTAPREQPRHDGGALAAAFGYPRIT